MGYVDKKSKEYSGPNVSTLVKGAKKKNWKGGNKWADYQITIKKSYLKVKNPKTEKEMGIEKQILTPGNGPKPVAGQKVTVHCTGYG